MPTARNGEALSQASILYCSGARHWSKPRPVKSPGVTGLVASCAAALAGIAPAPGCRDGVGGDRRGGGLEAAHSDRRGGDEGDETGQDGHEEGSWGKVGGRVPQAP